MVKVATRQFGLFTAESAESAEEGKYNPSMPFVFVCALRGE
jgi:hypothetical protein